ncbi:hypothetical protein HK097_005031, partial [Rhizophlyctis rosea]
MRDGTSSLGNRHEGLGHYAGCRDGGSRGSPPWPGGRNGIACVHRESDRCRLNIQLTDFRDTRLIEKLSIQGNDKKAAILKHQLDALFSVPAELATTLLIYDVLSLLRHLSTSPTSAPYDPKSSL